MWRYDIHYLYLNKEKLDKNQNVLYSISHTSDPAQTILSFYCLHYLFAEQLQQWCFGSGLTRRLMPLLTTPTEVGTTQYLSSMYAVLYCKLSIQPLVLLIKKILHAGKYNPWSEYP